MINSFTLFGLFSLLLAINILFLDLINQLSLINKFNLFFFSSFSDNSSFSSLDKFICKWKYLSSSIPLFIIFLNFNNIFSTSSIILITFFFISVFSIDSSFLIKRRISFNCFISKNESLICKLGLIIYSLSNNSSFSFLL